MNIKKIISAVICTVIITAALPSCAIRKSADSSKEKASYKYGKIQIPGKDGALCGAPIYVAYEKGYFAEEGFDVELISADTETRKIGLNNGTIPIVNGDFQFFPSMEQGINVSVVDGLHFGCIKFVVLPDSDIKTAEDLKGKKLGVDEIGGTPHQVASVWLENAGISARQEDKEVTFLPYSDGNLELEALYNGDIDVACMWDPLGSVSAKEGKTKIIFDLSTDPQFEGKYCCFLYASNKVLKEDPEKVAALLRAYRKAQDFISRDPEGTVDLIINGKYSQITDKELAVDLIKSYEYPSYDARKEAPDRVKENVEYFAAALNDIGYLETSADDFVSKYYSDVKVE